MNTYEDILASQSELAHFNHNHDKLGRFAKSRNSEGKVTSDSGKQSTQKSKAREAAKKLKNAIRSGRTRVDDSMEQLRNMQFMQMINDQQIMNQQIQNQLLIQQAIQESNRCASLSMTMGMNPFMFG